MRRSGFSVTPCCSGTANAVVRLNDSLLFMGRVRDPSALTTPQ